MPLFNWNLLSLRNQMLITFGFSATISLILVESLSIGFLFLVTRNISSTSADTLVFILPYHRHHHHHWPYHDYMRSMSLQPRTLKTLCLLLFVFLDNSN